MILFEKRYKKDFHLAAFYTTLSLIFFSIFLSLILTPLSGIIHGVLAIINFAFGKYFMNKIVDSLDPNVKGF